MSEIARELKMLFYLNEKFDKAEMTSIRELSEFLEISPRQVRRYRNDLEQTGFSIVSEHGVNGGYKLMSPLDKSLVIPENLLLALNVALKNNISLLESLNKLPVVSGKLSLHIEGDHFISNERLDKEVFIVGMIQKRKKISFMYEETENKSYPLTVEPYKLVFTNRGYYLKAYYSCKFRRGLSNYSIDKMSDIKEIGDFEFDSNLLETIKKELKYYGIIQKHLPIELKLKYKDKTDEYVISKYFEGKVRFNNDKVCTIETINKYECFYPIFSLGQKVEIIDKGIKEEYKEFLRMKLEELR